MTPPTSDIRPRDTTTNLQRVADLPLDSSRSDRRPGLPPHPGFIIMMMLTSDVGRVLMLEEFGIEENTVNLVVVVVVWWWGVCCLSTNK